MNTKLAVIDALCVMGNTEGVGRFATPYKDDIIPFMRDFFGEFAHIDGEVKEDTYYVYSYSDTLPRCEIDATIYVCDDTTIFLYEIED
jgi:hypothetical protein